MSHIAKILRFNYFALVLISTRKLSTQQMPSLNSLQPLRDVLISLRDGNSTKTTFMSNEERRFMWNLALVLAVKHRAIAFRTYHMILSFITFHGLFMGPGYDLGEGSIWRIVDPDDDW